MRKRIIEQETELKKEIGKMKQKERKRQGKGNIKKERDREKETERKKEIGKRKQREGNK